MTCRVSVLGRTIAEASRARLRLLARASLPSVPRGPSDVPSPPPPLWPDNPPCLSPLDIPSPRRSLSTFTLVGVAPSDVPSPAPPSWLDNPPCLSPSDIPSPAPPSWPKNDPCPPPSDISSLPPSWVVSLSKPSSLTFICFGIFGGLSTARALAVGWIDTRASRLPCAPAWAFARARAWSRAPAWAGGFARSAQSIAQAIAGWCFDRARLPRAAARERTIALGGFSARDSVARASR